MILLFPPQAPARTVPNATTNATVNTVANAIAQNTNKIGGTK